MLLGMSLACVFAGESQVAPPLAIATRTHAKDCTIKALRCKLFSCAVPCAPARLPACLPTYLTDYPPARSFISSLQPLRPLCHNAPTHSCSWLRRWATTRPSQPQTTHSLIFHSNLTAGPRRRISGGRSRWRERIEILEWQLVATCRRCIPIEAFNSSEASLPSSQLLGKLAQL